VLATEVDHGLQLDGPRFSCTTAEFRQQYGSNFLNRGNHFLVTHVTKIALHDICLYGIVSKQRTDTSP